MSENKRVFQTRKTNNAVMFIGTFLATAVLTFFLLAYLFISFRISSDVPFFVRILVPVVLGSIVAPIATLTNKQITITIDDETFTYVKGEEKVIIPVEAFRGTYVVKNYNNGTYINSTRYLKFSNTDGSIRQIVIPFSEQEFSDMVLLLQNNRKADITEVAKENVRKSFTDEMRFEIPKEELSQAYKKSSVLRAKICILIVFIALVVCVLAYIYMEFLFFIAMTVLFGGLGSALAAGIFFYGRKETKNALANTPSFVLVEPFNLTFENKRYDASDISKIFVSPPEYKSLGKDNEFRMIVVTDRKGLDSKYYFGKAPKDNKNMVCEEYGDLIAAIDKWSYVNNIEFRMDLG